MAKQHNRYERPPLERSCSDWVRFAPADPVIERFEARFSGHAYDPHRHDSYAIGVTMHGVQQFDYRGTREDSVAGNVIVLHPDEAHDGQAGTEHGFQYRMLYIAPHAIRDALTDHAAALPFVRNAVSYDMRLRMAAVQALADLDSTLDPLERDQIVTDLADALLAQDASARNTTPQRISRTIADRARRILEEAYALPVSSEMLEQATGESRYTVARHFRAAFGTSPHRYLTMRRLDAVRAAIRNDMPIAEAAFACGFADQSHMTRKFRAAYGMPPGRWRAIQRG